MVKGGGPSHYRGVIWHKSNSKWETRIYENGKQRFLGYFTSEEEAARAYDSHALRLHSAAAKLNFPEGAVYAADDSLRQGRGMQQQYSQQQQAKRSSRFRGVSWNSNCSRWRAQLCQREVVHHLGYFDSEVAAARHYDLSVLRMRGPTALTNFPLSDYCQGPPKVLRTALAVKDINGGYVDLAESDYLGVSRVGKSRWVAEIWDGRKYESLGLFCTEDAAARAYDQACIEMYGAEANVNFPEERMSDDEGDDDGHRITFGELEANAVSVLASLSSQRINEDGPTPSVGQGIESVAASNFVSATEPTGHEVSSPLPKELQPVPDELLAHHLEGGNLESVAARRLGSASHIPGLITADLTTASLEVATQRPGDLKLDSGEESPTASNESAKASNTDMTRGLSAVLNRANPDCMSLRESCDNHNLQRAASICQHSTVEQYIPNEDRPQSVVRQTSSFKGVSWNVACLKWVAVIWDRDLKRARHLGTFTSDIDAARAYDCEALRLYGEAAAFNFSRVGSGDEAADSGLLGPGLSLLVPSVQTARQAVSAADVMRIEAPPPARRAASARAQGGAYAGLNGIRAAAKPKSSRGSSRFRGVSWCEKGKKWRALLWDGNRQHFLGHFKKEEDAARAYDIALIRRKKKDGCTNFPVSDYLEELQGKVPAERLAAGVRKPSSPPTPSAKQAARRPPSLDRSASDRVDTTEDSGSVGPVQSLGGGCGYQRGSSRFKGVSWSARRNKWRSQMWLGSKVLHLGFFEDEELAALAYDEAAIKHKGPNAPRNSASLYRTLNPEPIIQHVAPAVSVGGSEAREDGQQQGVHWHNCSMKWEARIFDGRQQVSLGYYDSRAAAAAAYNAETERLRGPGAYTGFAGREGSADGLDFSVLDLERRAPGTLSGKRRASEDTEDQDWAPEDDLIAGKRSRYR